MIGEVLGNYRITDQIGSGGMGLVFGAEHILLGKQAAIKVLKPERCEDPEIISRFFNEARAAAMVKDPGIPEIFDYGRLPGGNAYIVMEMLEGKTLGALLEELVRLSPGRALAMTRLLAGTLKATHAHGIIHRDLKPDNIFVVPDPAMPRGERIQILDFGIAKLQETDLPSSVQTETGRLMGTPYYMSPEQCRGAGDIDHRTDIYSLGCVLYQMLSGRPPFVLKGSGEVLAAHIHVKPKPVGEVQASIPEELAALTMRLLEKDPGKRPQTMAQVVSELNSIANFVGMVTPEPSLALSADMPLALEDVTLDDFQQHKKTTTLAGSSGEYLTTVRVAQTQRVVRPSFLRRKLLPMAAVMSLGIGGWGAWTVIEQRNSQQATQAQVVEAVVEAPVAVAQPAAPIIVRELVEVPEKVNYVTLDIRSSPKGVRVYRVSDGVELGRTPFSIDVRQGAGTMTFLVRKTGYKSAKVVLPVSRNGSKRIRLDRQNKRQQPIRAEDELANVRAEGLAESSETEPTQLQADVDQPQATKPLAERAVIQDEPASKSELPLVAPSLPVSTDSTPTP